MNDSVYEASDLKDRVLRNLELDHIVLQHTHSRSLAVVLLAVIAVVGCGNDDPRARIGELVINQLKNDTLTFDANVFLKYHQRNATQSQIQWAKKYATTGSSVTIAKFEFDRVTGIRQPNPETMVVEFSFHWVPTGDAGREFAVAFPDGNITYEDRLTWLSLDGYVWVLGIDSPSYQASAIYIKYDDGWRFQKLVA